MTRSLLIHNGNTPELEKHVDNAILFTLEDANIDSYIESQFIMKMKDIEFDIVFIKDALSFNHVDFNGLRMLLHIRLSGTLGSKIFVPIVILSETDSYVINKTSTLGHVLFTSNTYLAPNNLSTINKYMNKEIPLLTEKQYKNSFLANIEIKQPEDYLSHHSIANEWSMYRWAEYLDVMSNEIINIEDNISSMLYFKYLKMKYPVEKKSLFNVKKDFKETGKVLYIDDEWAKGWKSVLTTLFSNAQGPELAVVDEIYKDKTIEEIISFVMAHVKKQDPDVVILDMRLHPDDFNVDTPLAELSGVQIFQQIKELNPGIQCVIFTASSNSQLLEEIYELDESIVGYVKKEHPEDHVISTLGNINKLITKVDKGLYRSYLKKIWKIQKNIAIKLEQDPFRQYISNTENYKDNLGIIKRENTNVFDVLNSSLDNSFNNALVSIVTGLEAMRKIFIKDSYDPRHRKTTYTFWDGSSVSGYSLKYMLQCILTKVHNSDLKGLTNQLDTMTKRRNNYIHSNNKYTDIKINELTNWYELLNQILSKISSGKKEKSVKKMGLDEPKSSIRGLESLKNK